MKKDEIIQRLKKHVLFEKTELSAIEALINAEDTEIMNFKQGDEMFSPQKEEKKLGFILVGEASVYSADGNRSVLLRSLCEGDSFGVSNLFDTHGGFVSLIVAKKASSVIFFSPAAISSLLERSGEFRMSYIRFLSQKICFLNRKISCFTAGSPERRLAVFLSAQSNEESYSLNLNANSLSEMLNVGRASLYRAFDKLTADGFISRNGKIITVFNRTALENHYTD